MEEEGKWDRGRGGEWREQKWKENGKQRREGGRRRQEKGGEKDVTPHLLALPLSTL